MNRLTAIAAIGLASFAMEGRAIVFESTADPDYNTSAPTGPLAGSGWQYQGEGPVAGTPIASQYFITAKHIGGSVGQIFVYGGTNYTTTAMYDQPDGDLRIFKVDLAFSSYAPMYTASDEVGKDIVFFGRGAGRGAEVVVSGTARGWEWTNVPEDLRWGENEISSIVDGGNVWGNSILAFTFDQGTGNPNEAGLAFGDSGGGVFILDDGIWKLAGVNLGADGPYNTTPSYGGEFSATLYNQDGLYAPDFENQWQLMSGPGASYASRISSNQIWINSVIVPEPSANVLLGTAGIVLTAWQLRRMRKR
ncbi:MAG TPA: hypothetical protein PLS03_17955 [Terrimicrobiaceae bacterium]|nr:hypothetical protein [Terrimicrobiaceae bacterium]